MSYTIDLLLYLLLHLEKCSMTLNLFSKIFFDSSLKQLVK